MCVHILSVFLQVTSKCFSSTNISAMNMSPNEFVLSQLFIKGLGRGVIYPEVDC